MSRTFGWADESWKESMEMTLLKVSARERRAYLGLRGRCAWVWHGSQDWATSLRMRLSYLENVRGGKAPRIAATLAWPNCRCARLSSARF